MNTAHTRSLIQAALDACETEGLVNGGEAVAEYLKSALDVLGTPEGPTTPDDFVYPAGMNAGIVIDLICNAWDGNATGYWGVRDRVEVPEGYDQSKAPKGWTANYERKYTAPLMGGRVALFDPEAEDFAERYYADENGGEPAEPDYWLDGAAIQRGLDCFATVSPRQFANAVKEDHDAITADVFLQCCLLGEITYG